MRHMSAADEVVDGQVVAREVRPLENPTPEGLPIWPTNTPRPPMPGVVDQAYTEVMGSRARAITLFVKVPFLAYIALNDKLPGIVRFGAAALGVYEAMQLASQQSEIEQMLPEVW